MSRLQKLRRADLERITAATAKAEARTSAEPEQARGEGHLLDGRLP